MPLSLQTQWTLVASGLIAHADEVMAGEECERLMALLDERADEDEYSDWFELVSDPDRLFAQLDALPDLPEEHHRAVLEEAWLMAAADGKRVPEEAEMLGRVARKLGVESVQLDFWREAWTAAQNATCEAGTRAIVYCLVGGDRSAAKDQRDVAQRVWDALPVTDDQQPTLQRLLTEVHSETETLRQINALERPHRKVVLRAVAQVMRLAADDKAHERFRQLADDAGLDDEVIATLLRGD